jgi:activating signal cointegrator 1
MRALTLTQPWAGLVAAGIKMVENRSRLIIKREDYGTPFAVHASRSVDAGVYSRIREIDPALFDFDPHSEKAWPLWYRLSRVTSAIIAVAEIQTHWTSLHQLPQAEVFGVIGTQARWAFGPIVYQLRNIRALAQPVPCRGWQGFWRMTNETELAVAAQLGEAQK